MSRKKRKKHHKIGFVSNIKINTKVLIIFISLIISVGAMFAGMIAVVTNLREENKKEMEMSVSVSAEQYINTAIESMISISKTVYTNEDVYSFLNKRYQSTVDYFDYYYNFSQSRVLVVTEDSAVKQFSIYTANDTVLNGGNISRLDSVVNEPWYEHFKSMDRDMIIYCDTENKNLSLIRKLDYKNVTTGEAIIKFELNTAGIHDIFKNIHFDGDVFVMCNDVVLCSNQQELKSPEYREYTSGTEFSKNYYTCEISYHVYGNDKSIISILMNVHFIPMVLVFIAGLIVIVVIIMDFKNRTMEVCDVCTEKKITRKVYFGEDEIGKLYNHVKNTLLDVYRLNDEKNNLKLFTQEYKDKTNDVILNALAFDAKIKFGLSQDVSLSEAIPLKKELTTMGRFLDELRVSKNLDYSLISDTETTEKTVVPYSLTAIALHVAEYGKTECSMEIDVREFEGCYRIKFYKKGIGFNASDLLRLRAVFEPDGERSLPVFEAGDNFNPYIRLSRFYCDDISLIINSKEEIDFELVIKNQTG